MAGQAKRREPGMRAATTVDKLNDWVYQQVQALPQQPLAKVMGVLQDIMGAPPEGVSVGMMPMPPGAGGMGLPKPEKWNIGGREMQKLKDVYPLTQVDPVEEATRRIMKAHNLQPSEYERVKRGVQQGFTEPGWHGTAPARTEADIANYKGLSEFKSGRQAKEGGDLGVHIATRPETADFAVDAFREGKNIMPLQFAPGKSLNVPDMGLFKSPTNWLVKAPEFRAMGDQGPIVDEILDRAAAVRNISAANPATFMNAAQEQTMFEQMLNELMQKHGYGSLKYTNRIEGAGEPSFAVMDPRRIRSVWAKFDPKLLGKTRDILAEATPIAGAVEVKRREPK